jgi:hypothetical protein
MIYKSEVAIYIFRGATIDGHECSSSLVVVAAVAEVADKPTRVFKRPFCLFSFFSPLPSCHTHTTHPCGSLLFDSPVCLSVCLPRHYIRLKTRNNKQDAPPKKRSLKSHTTTENGRKNDPLAAGGGLEAQCRRRQQEQQEARVMNELQMDGQKKRTRKRMGKKNMCVYMNVVVVVVVV